MLKTDCNRYSSVVHVERDTNNDVLQGIPLSYDFDVNYDSLSIDFHNVRVDMTKNNFSLKIFSETDVRIFNLVLLDISSIMSGQYITLLSKSEMN